MTDEEIDKRFLCLGCSVDTSSCASGEYYMVTDEVWLSVVSSKNAGMLCIGCLEGRLGRELTPADFHPCLLNTREYEDMKSERLKRRLGWL